MIRLLRARFAGARYRAVATLASGTALGQLIGFAALPAITRLHRPADFAEYSLVIAVSLTGVSLTTAGYGTAIPLAASRAAARDLVLVGAVSILTVSSVLGVATAAVINEVSSLGGSLSDWLPLVVAGSLCAAGLLNLVTQFATRESRFGSIAVSRTVQGGTMSALQIGSGALAMGSLGLVLGDVFGRLTAAFRLMSSQWKTLARQAGPVSARQALATARSFAKYPMFQSWSGVLYSTATQSPLLLFPILFGLVPGGQFALALRVLRVPVLLVGNSVGQYYMSHAPRVFEDGGIGALGRVTRRMTRDLMIWGLVPWSILAGVSPMLFEFAFGSEWRVAGDFARVLALSVMLELVATPLMTTLNVIRREGVRSLVDILRAGAVVAPLTLTAMWDGSAADAVLAYSLTTAVALSIIVLVTLRAVRDRPS